jgi:predicted metal-dependent HD superfamily phosphohydrolase
MDLKSIESETQRIVKDIYTSPKVPHYPYHNLGHTMSVVAHVKEMAAHYHLPETDSSILGIAAWFHDIGQLSGDMAGHEERSIAIMMDHVRDVPRDWIVAISQCILATKVPSHPNTLLEKIICDADTYHFGTPLFRETDAKVRQEMTLRTGKAFPDWHKKSLLLLQQHVFFTDYCRNLLKKGKTENMAWLVGQIANDVS